MEGDLSMYLFLQEKLLKDSDGKVITYQETKKIINNLKFRKPIFHIIIIELERLGLIQRVTPFKFKVINPERCSQLNSMNNVCKN